MRTKSASKTITRDPSWRGPDIKTLPSKRVQGAAP